MENLQIIDNEPYSECQECGNIVEDWELDWYDQDYICQDCADKR